MQLERIGPYRIVRLLGKGGMGAVYEGLHEAIERRVAIKVLHAELGRRADMATRFINEARAVNRIDHPGLVAVSDFGQLPDGTAYIVMEFLKGETLGQRLKRAITTERSRLPVTDVIRLGRQMGSALAAAHDKDIVHRDLKPDNIMIVPNADVPGGELIKILDFGIAKVAEVQSGISEAHTRADALLGTPRYMSPEQCKGSGTVDAKSDVYSLGVIFYEVLAGKPPFAGSAHGELIVQHMMNEPPPLQQFVDPSAPDGLLGLVHAMLRKDRETRPNMRQVVAEMDKMGGYMSGVYGVVGPAPSGVSMPGAGSGLPTPAPGALGSGHPSFPGSQSVRAITMPGSSQSVPTPVPGSSTLAAAAGQAPPASRPRWPIAVAIGSIVGAVAVGVVLVTTLKPPQQQMLPPPPPPPKVAKQPDVEAPKKMVKSQVSSEPAGAKVIRQSDGQVLGVTPLLLSNPAGGSEKVRVVLQGYLDEALTLDLSRDSEQKVEFKRPKIGRDGKRPKNPKDPKDPKYVKGDLTVVD